ncbi:hypothetical protein CAP47_11565 [Psychroflexus sp. S27]|uniref:hypothetical protein n=1 Tax=Psychroflexus sp. S27 TaxID=1982757 RepID=UPI000C29FDBE|nr:hypothetical protein [Psychroflexus sp. S27]PJX20163.1 hypothetical protein CAP47_11565 [Psychroflexus sp. S27]
MFKFNFFPLSFLFICSIILISTTSCHNDDFENRLTSSKITTVNDTDSNIILNKGTSYEFDFSKLSNRKVIELSYLDQKFLVTKTNNGISLQISNEFDLNHRFIQAGVEINGPDSSKLPDDKVTNGIIPIFLHMCCVKIKVEVGDTNQFTWEWDCTCI